MTKKRVSLIQKEFAASLKISSSELTTIMGNHEDIEEISASGSGDTARAVNIPVNRPKIKEKILESHGIIYRQTSGVTETVYESVIQN